ncbi:MAG: hypothetical protein K6G19_02475 [Lachnospiraceae bacterium]|nr:hypothetical protein [Lachnospiraceae bacterium]
MAEATEEPDDDNPNEDPYADGIIPLYNIMLEDQVKQTEPDLWFTNFDETILPFYQLYTTDTTVAGCTAFKLTDLAVEPIESVALRGPEGTDYTTNVAIYIFETDYLTEFCFETEDGTQHIESLVPFFYNEAKGCLVGYTRPDSDPDNIRFVEVYWSAAGNTSRMIDVDPSEYGF